MGADPVTLGLVASLNHPGGNITGVTVAVTEVLQKRLQLLHHLICVISIPRSHNLPSDMSRR
jgi:putative tryptophan/tyrosine transport system substrate-binding protein